MAALVYGALCYVLFLLTFLYAIGGVALTLLVGVIKSMTAK